MDFWGHNGEYFSHCSIHMNISRNRIWWRRAGSTEVCPVPFLLGYKWHLSILLLIILVLSATAHTAQPLPWEEKHQQLLHQRDLIFEQLDEIHSVLVPRVQEEDPVLLKRLSLDPPQSRATGYGLLPEVKDNAPQAPVAPKQTFYSLKWLEGRLNEELESVEKLANDIPGTTKLEPLVARFEQSLKKLRNLENNLTYHKYWQKAVVQYAAYFRKKNELVALAREMNTLITNSGPPEKIAELRQQLLQRTAPFRPTRGLQILNLEEGEMVLPVTVCTDIENLEFLHAFKEGVQEAFSLSSAAQTHRFSVDLIWRLIRADTLYPDGVPVRGASIVMSAHRTLFTNCSLVLTTGAPSLNALVGNRIFLGTRPVSRRTLAHEFGHLLGFEDAYVRGYDGETSGPYGVVIVEWTGLTADLMGDSGRGRVSEEMITTLINAYGELAVE